MDTTQSASSELPEFLTISGFWRRVGALFIDSMLMGIVGWMIGAAFFDSLARMGDSAKIIGFVIALAYFGIGNSRLTGGQTLAKRWLGLRVVDVSGQTLSLPRSTLRYVVLGLPFFANGLTLDPQLMMSSVLGYLLSLVVFGGIFSIIYLYIFNRRTRQSLHDLAVGSYVVQVEPLAGRAAFPTIWRGHLVTIAVLAVIALSAPLVASKFAKTTTFAASFRSIKRFRHSRTSFRLRWFAHGLPRTANARMPCNRRCAWTHRSPKTVTWQGTLRS